MSAHPQDSIHQESLQNPEDFWRKQASYITWHKKPDKTLEITKKTLPDGSSHPAWKWFPGGEVSTCYNCLDRHVKDTGHGDNIAIIWESPVTNDKQKFTYAQLLDEVEVLAGVLLEEGVQKGQVVLIYMPMIPAALIAMLAINRIGAIHAVVFGGFSPPSLAQRIEASSPAAIMTASCGIEAGKKPIGYKTLIESAIHQSKHKPAKTIIWQRDQHRWHPVNKGSGERNWQRLVKSARNRGVRAGCTPVKSNDAVYIIYTSGTTGAPKGVVREAAGHVVGLDLSIKYLFGIERGDVIFTASDVGWVVGHSYILYAPLLAGATTVQFEGKPIYPDAGIFWRLIEEHKINVLFTAPTALRAIRQLDPDSEKIQEVGKRGGLKSLRALFLAGERSEPSIVELYTEHLKSFGDTGASIVDNWWSSESGSPMTGLAQKATIRDDSKSSSLEHKPLLTKPGSAGKPMPGFDIRVVDDDGKECERGTMGNLVLGLPFAPTGLTQLWNDDERFLKSYLKRFGGKFMDTGDSGIIDGDGYVHVMSRADDIINVAAHRLSTGAIEQAVCSHPEIMEACVVGIPDSLKGHLPFAFVVINPAIKDVTEERRQQLFKEVNQAVRTQLGGIASLGGMIQGRGMIPKTRSGKTLRRVLRELLENAIHGDFEKDVSIPTTIEDIEVVAVAKEKIKDYFESHGKGKHKSIEGRPKL
ncbi:acyl-CoA synthetase/AMP-acid ligase-like protein [Microthyrium microscopicum]|uniref:Acyl-CoA synthetase/AMP-acid ligase-like protein n=1 Tax=Microthyrium microscopicum TaxID=703497 RepID=A0A6A6U077_9PEZI|nr:acyl-CoA synthetase/AMP-acid ligase-like protein [Microthyrium microscopicum]